MKMFSVKKIVSLLLVLTMCVGLGNMNIQAGGTEATVDIISKNVSYGETLKLAFALDAQNLSEGDEVLLVLTKDGKSVGVTRCENQTVKGVDAIIYKANSGVAPQNIGDVYTAKAQIVNGGQIVAESKEYTYSVLEYLYERLYVTANVDADHKELYTQMLAYAEVAEKVLSNPTTTKIKDSAYVYVSGGTVDGTNVGGVYKSGDVLSDIASNIEISEGYELEWKIEEFNAAGTQTGIYEFSAEEFEGYTVSTAKRVKITASLKESNVVEKQWTLVTNVADLKAGEQIVIVAANSNYAISTTQNNNNRGQAVVAKSSDKNTVTFGDTVQIITLTEGTKSGTFGFKVGNGYLYAASSTANYLKTQATNNDNGSWKVTITTAGVATITAQGSSSRNLMRHNSSSSLFSCYSSGQQDVCIYMYK